MSDGDEGDDDLLEEFGLDVEREERPADKWDTDIGPTRGVGGACTTLFRGEADLSPVSFIGPTTFAAEIPPASGGVFLTAAEIAELARDR